MPPGWFQRHARALLWLRIAVLTGGVPVLIYWALSEQALGLEQGFGVTLAAGIVLSQLAIVVYACRFRTSLTIVGIQLGVLETLRINTLSLFYQFFVPMSVGADITKLVKLKARRHRSVASVSGIVLDHFVGLLGLLLLAGTVMAWRRPLALNVDVGIVVVLTVVLMVLAGLAAVFWVRRRRFALRELVQIMSNARLRLAAAMALALLMHVLMAAAIYVASLGWGLPIGYTDILFVMTTALIFQAVPVNIAGLGLTEVAGTGLYVALGVPLAGAVLLVSLLYVYRLLAAIIGGLWDLLPPATGRAH